MTGKGAIACTHPLIGRPVRPLFAHRQRPDRGIRLPDRRRLQARRDRDQALPADRRPGKPLIHLDIVAEEIGRTTRTEVALWGDARAGAAGPCRGALRRRRRARRSAEYWCAEVARAHGRNGARGAADRLKSDETPINVGAPDGRAQPAHAGGRDPRRRRRLRRPLGRAALRHQAGRPALHRRPRLRLDRLRPARRDGRAARRARRAASSASPATAAST